MAEIWKEVKGYNGRYLVSNMGRLKDTKKNEIKFTTNRKGEIFNLIKGKKTRNVNVKILVAEAFIPNPENKKYVQQKDFDRHNNKVSNLHWTNHPIKRSYNPGKRVERTNMLTGEKEEFKSVAAAVRATPGLTQRCDANISMACHGKIKGAYGFYWRYLPKKENE